MKVDNDILSFILCFLLLTSLSAQDPPKNISDLIGKKVRVSAPNYSNKLIKGKVLDVRGDTLQLFVENWPNLLNIPPESIARLEINAITKKTRIGCAAKGGLFGATVGATVGSVFWGINWGSSGVRDAPSRTSYIAIRSILCGLTGTVIGAGVGAGRENWQEFPIKDIQKDSTK